MTNRSRSAENSLATVLEAVASLLRQPAERSSLVQAFVGQDLSRPELQLLALIRAGRTWSVRFSPFRLHAREVFQVLKDGFPVVWLREVEGRDEWWVFLGVHGRRIEGVRVLGTEMETRRLELGQLQAMVGGSVKQVLEWCLVAQPLLFGVSSHLAKEVPSSSDAAHSADAGHSEADSHHHHAGMRPWQRLLRMIRPDYRDIGSLILFAVVSGVLGLATPLAVEWVVTTVGFGRYLQPLLVLSFILLTLLLFAAVMRVLQAIVVESIQRRLFARVVGDLAFRLPNAKRSSLHGSNGVELVNRFLDVATVQKGVATVLTDGISITLTTVIGMVLLAFYHPFLLGFDLVLLLSMLLITFALGRGGVKTATEESIQKYRLTHWFQDVVSNPTAFRLLGGDAFSTDRANRITVNYIVQRRRHFAVLLRQMLFAVSLQAIASTALLGIGGWLVLRNQLTLGQLVASELVLTVIVGAFAKITKTLETFYDLMASVDKIGHLLDVPLEAPTLSIPVPEQPASVRWSGLQYLDEASRTAYSFADQTIEPGARISLNGGLGDSASILMSILAGLRETHGGHADIDGLDCRDIARSSFGQSLAIASDIEIFHGTILENIDVHRSDVTLQDIQWSLEIVEVRDMLLRLSSGMETMLETQGHPLTREQRARLMIARAIAGKPRVLLIDGTLDLIPFEIAQRILTRLASPEMPWTLIVSSHNRSLVEALTPVIIQTNS